MTRRWRWATALVAVVATAVCLGAVAQKPSPAKPLQSAEQLMGVALHQEEVEGSLQAAIATYQQVLKTPGVPRALAARALFRIGACYERLGVDGARKAYEAVVANYGDQSELAAQAKARLVALGGGASARVARASTEVLKNIWPAETNYVWERVSPDGRQVAGCETTNGDVVVRELEGGRVKNLTSLPVAERTPGYCVVFSSIWSRDGRFVAMDWSEGQAPARVQGLRINDLRDGTARFLPLDTRFGRANLLDWAVDGQSVLVRVWEKRETGKKAMGALAWVSVSNGAIRPLMVLDPPTGPITAFQSPDGKWVAVREGAFRSVPTLILSSDGSEKRELLPVMDNARLVGWSPDGEHLLLSQSGDVGSLMAVRVVGGKADGPPFVVRRLPGFSSLGMTTDGRLLFKSIQPGTPRLYVAPFELATHSAGPAAALSPSEFTSINLISWSPDGKTLAYIGSDSTYSRKTLAAWSFETRQTITYSLPMSALSSHPLTWSSDSRSIYTSLTDKGRRGLYRVSLVTGAVEAVVPVDSGVLGFPLSLDTTLVGWSPDATRLYKKVNVGQAPSGLPMALIEHRLADHAERELYRTPGGSGIGAFAVSPDGSTLAFMAGGPQGGGLILVPAAGGQARVLAPGHRASHVYWSADGRFVFTSDGLGPGSAWMFEVAGGSGTRLTLPSETTVNAVTLSPDNKQLAFVAGTEQKDEGVWMLENFLPPAKPTTKAAKKEP
jgi:Tol biopolymer transport system component